MAEDRNQRQNQIIMQATTAILLGIGSGIALGLALSSVWWGVFFGIVMTLIFLAGSQVWVRRS